MIDNYYKKYTAKIIELIKIGKEFEKYEKQTKDARIKTVQAGDKLTEWLVNVENIVTILFSKEHFQYKTFQNLKSKKIFYFSTIREIFGFLQGILNDINDNLLQSLEYHIGTKISMNILDNAKELNNNNHLLAAAIYVRIALENKLKKIAEYNSISPNQSASKLKDELYKKRIFDKHERSKIQSWLDIGNFAAHGLSEFNNYNKSRINEFILNVENFINKIN